MNITSPFSSFLSKRSPSASTSTSLAPRPQQQDPPPPISLLPVDIFAYILTLTYIPWISKPLYLSYIPLEREVTTRYDNLCSCSLVSRAWREESQRQLVEEVRLCYDGHAEKWVKNAIKGRTKKLVLNGDGMSDKWVEKILKECDGVSELELYFLRDFRATWLGMKSLSGLKKLSLGSSVLTYRTKMVKMPFLRSRLVTTTYPTPPIPFSLTHLDLNTETIHITNHHISTILSTSLRSLEYLILRGVEGEEANLIGKVMKSSTSDIASNLKCIQLPYGIITDDILSALENASNLNDIKFRGNARDLLRFVDACTTSTYFRDITLYYSATSLSTEDYENLKPKLGWLSERGINKLKVDLWDGEGWPVGRGFGVRWITGKTPPDAKFALACELAGIKLVVVEREEWKVSP